MIETKTKSQRGHRLRSSISALSGDAPLNSLAQQADDIVLRPDMSAVEAFRWIVITSLGHLLTNQAVGLAGEGQGMCQIGAAIWRLRATLTLFKPYLEPNATFRFQSELRVVSRLFRGARNRDVFFADATPGDAVLRPSAKTAHKAAHHDLIRTLRAPSFTALVLGLTAWVEGSALMDPLCRQPLSQLASPLLSRLARRLYRHPIEHQSDLEWHALSRLLEDLRCGIKLSSIYSEHVANT